jgi:hypothetical protein
VLLSLFIISFNLFSQEKPKKAARPNIPGSFMIDLGVNRALNKPANFKYGFWGSRTLNLYYQYPIRIGRSKFSFNPGIGASMERWKFTNNYVITDTTENSIDEFLLLPGSSFYKGLKKSMLVANYVEIPLEFRFDTAPEDIARSFNVAIGGRIGYLFESKMKVKYKEDGETKILKDKQNLGLTQIRYGVYSRIGVGAFNIFGFYNLTPLFEKDKGPDKTTMNSYTVGISINGF